MSTLQGASKYLNNLLLARGLLHDGKTIDFANPSNEAGQNDATMSKVINLVHELVLRRDRESERYESMVTAIQNLRAQESQRLLDFQRLQEKNAQLRGELTMAQSLERNLRNSQRKAELQAKELKDQILKTKSLLDSVRAKCLSDVKKKDIEIEKLKGHISGFQRGTKQASGVKLQVINSLTASAGGKDRRIGQDIHSQDWSLDKETNDFLAAIVNETSSENVALRQIIEDSIATLRELTALSTPSMDQRAGNNDLIEPSQSFQHSAESLLPCHVLEERMVSVVDVCKSILRDPSFVSVEEVNVREEEIAKLKAGWEKMADRWKEAVVMMSQWKQRMALEGRSEEAGEFSSLSFGRSVAVRPNGEPVLDDDSELSLPHEPEDAVFNDLDLPPSPESSPPQIDDEESDLDLELEPAPKRLASSPAKRGLRLPRAPNPLEETSGNINTKAARDGNVHANQKNMTFDDIRDRADQDLSGNFQDKENRPGHMGLTTGSKPRTITLSEKLAAVENEATEAEALRKAGATRKRSVPTKSTKKGRGSRRRSTLSPEELASLMKAR